MSDFTPFASLVGGILIGLAAVILLLGNGHILGASHIAGTLILTPRKAILYDPYEKWNVEFLASFLITSKLFHWCSTDQNTYYIDEFRLLIDSNLPIVSSSGFAISGFLVGCGSKLGNGCTSGHGICGMARLSKRSIVAVISFMAIALGLASACTPDGVCGKYVYINNLTAANSDSIQSGFVPTQTSQWIASILTVSIVVTCLVPCSWTRYFPRRTKVNVESKLNSCHLNKINHQRNISKFMNVAVTAFSALLFSVGLAIGGMTTQTKLFAFLDITRIWKTMGWRGTWDPSLMFVMGGGMFVSFLGYQFVEGWNIIKHQKTISLPLTQRIEGRKFEIPCNHDIDTPLIVGAFLFGAGWGLGGMCPGPAVYVAANGFPNFLYQWWPSYIVGYCAARTPQRFYRWWPSSMMIVCLIFYIQIILSPSPNCQVINKNCSYLKNITIEET